jgi:hypothetical protein
MLSLATREYIGAADVARQQGCPGPFTALAYGTGISSNA